MELASITFPSFELSGTTLPTWGVFGAIAFLLSSFLLVKQSERRGITPDHMIGILFSMLIGGLVGGRLGYLLLNQTQITLEELASLSGIFFEGNISVVGTYFGATILMWFYIRGFDIINQAKMSTLRLIDTTLYIVPFFAGIGYIGALFAGTMQGEVTSSTWALQNSDGVFTHPVALYYAVSYLVLFVLLYVLRRRVPRSRITGFITGIVVLSVSIIHLLVPFWEVREGLIGGISAEQCISLGVFVITGISIIVTREHRYQAVKQELIDHRVIF